MAVCRHGSYAGRCAAPALALWPLMEPRLLLLIFFEYVFGRDETTRFILHMEKGLSGVQGSEFGIYWGFGCSSYNRRETATQRERASGIRVLKACKRAALPNDKDNHCWPRKATTPEPQTQNHPSTHSLKTINLNPINPKLPKIGPDPKTPRPVLCTLRRRSLGTADLRLR